MKKLLLLALLCPICMLNAQKNREDFDPDYDYEYFRDISFEAGIQPALQQGNTDFQMIYYRQVSASWYFTEKKGFTIGLLYSDNLEGASEMYSVPLYFSYRTKFRYEYINFLYGIVYAIMPTRFELHAGPDFYFIEPVNSISTWSSGTQTFQKGYKVNGKFGFSVDAGFKLSYQIWRIGVFARLDLCYFPTRNFKYINTQQPDIDDQPSFFFKAGVGASFHF